MSNISYENQKRALDKVAELKAKTAELKPQTSELKQRKEQNPRSSQ